MTSPAWVWVASSNSQSLGSKPSALARLSHTQMAAPEEGVEPSSRGSKPRVLPLDDSGMFVAAEGVEPSHAGL
jgi:hypothetical protein